MPLPLIGWAVIGGTLVYLLSKDDEDTENNLPKEKKDSDGKSEDPDFNREEVRRLRSELRKAQKKLRASSTTASPVKKK